MSGNFEKARVVNENEPSTLDEELRELEGATENMREIIFSSFELYDKLLNHLYNAGNIRSHEYFFDDLEQLIYKMRRVQEAAQSINVRILDDETLNIQNPIGSQRLFSEEECRKYEMARGSFTLWLKRLNNTLAYFTKILEIIKSAKTSGSKKGLVNPNTLIDDTRNILTDFFNRSGIKFEEYQRYDEDRKKQVSQKASAMLDALLFIAPALSSEAREKIRRLHKNYAQVFDSSSYWRRLINLKFRVLHVHDILDKEFQKLLHSEALELKGSIELRNSSDSPYILPNPEELMELLDLFERFNSDLIDIDTMLNPVIHIAHYLDADSYSYDKLERDELPPSLLNEINSIVTKWQQHSNKAESIKAELVSTTSRILEIFKSYIYNGMFRVLESKILSVFTRLKSELDNNLKRLTATASISGSSLDNGRTYYKMRQLFEQIKQYYLLKPIKDPVAYMRNGKGELSKAEVELLMKVPIDVIEDMRMEIFSLQNSKTATIVNEIDAKFFQFDKILRIIFLGDEEFMAEHAIKCIESIYNLYIQKGCAHAQKSLQSSPVNMAIVKRVIACPERYIKYLPEDLHEFVLGVQEPLADTGSAILVGNSALSKILRTANTLRDNSA